MAHLYKGYTILGTSDVESHLAQVMAIHEDFLEYMDQTFSGKRFIAARVIAKDSSKHWLVNVHFPHNDNSMEDYEDALCDLLSFINMHRRECLLLAGDWNADRESIRALLLDASPGDLGLQPLRGGMHTRFGTQSSAELDYYFINDSFRSVASLDTLAVVADDPQHRLQLGSDHSAVQLNFSIRRPQPKQRTRARKRCGVYQVNKNMVERRVASGIFRFDDMDVKSQWEVLRKVSNDVSFRMTSLKYVDSDEIKSLCALRRAEVNPNEKSRLTRLIVSKRLQCRAEWWGNLEKQASCGDCAAVKYLRRRRHLDPK